MVDGMLYRLGNPACDPGWLSCSRILAHSASSFDFLLESCQMPFQFLYQLLWLQFFGCKQQIFQIICSDDEVFPCRDLFCWHYFHSVICELLQSGQPVLHLAQFVMKNWAASQVDWDRVYGMTFCTL
jgi:hypothetical protein